LVYDEKNDLFILYGGGLVGKNQTWVYDMNTNLWEQKQPPTNPGGVSRHEMVFDPISGMAILYGGQVLLPNGGLVNWDKTWGYDLATNTWELLSP
jgi:hypothetical protein